MLIALKSRKDRAEQVGGDQIRPLVAIFTEPEEHFAGGGMFAQTAIERGAQFRSVSRFGEDLRKLRNEPRVAALHELERACDPAVAERCGESLEGAALLGGGKFRENAR